MEYLIGVVIGIVIVYSISWFSHRMMYSTKTEPCGYATFAQFLRKFESVEGVLTIEYSNAIFITDPRRIYRRRASIHLNCIKFGENYMIIRFSNWGKFVLWRYAFLRGKKIEMENIRKENGSDLDWSSLNE